MESLTKEQIKEIAEQLDCGFRCYWHKQNGELVFVPDTMRYPDMDIDAWSDEMEKLDNDIEEYREIENLESRDSFEIMAGFIETLSDANKLKDRLAGTLSEKKPFSQFKFTIDRSGDFRQKWFDFKNRKMQEWVEKRFDEFLLQNIFYSFIQILQSSTG